MTRYPRGYTERLERVRMKVAQIAARVSPASSILPRAVDIEALAEAALADLDALLGEAK